MKATTSDINRIARLAESGYTNQVRKELQQYPDAIRYPQITIAAIKGAAIDTLKMLFASGADVSSGGSALLNEVAVANKDILNLCIKELEARLEDKPEALYARGCAMLSHAASHAKTEQLGIMLDKGYGSVNADHLRQPLLDASKKGSLEAVELLLHYNAKPENIHFNAAAEHGYLAVMMALKAANEALSVDRQVSRVVIDKREAAIGTSQFERWAEIADLCESPVRKHQL